MPSKMSTKSSLSFLAAICLASPNLWADENPARSPFSPELEVTVPYEPTALHSDNQQRLVYELTLRNFERGTLDVLELAVLEADSAQAVAVFDATELQALIRPIGSQSSEAGSRTTLASGGSAIVYLLLTFDAGVDVPARLQHRVRTSLGELVTDSIGTSHDTLRVLGAPVTGSGWLAETGLSNANGHRRGNAVLHGRSVISRRYAFDWVQVEGGSMHAGDKTDNAAYYGYGEALVAVADAVVASASDDMQENTPGGMSVPDTYANIAGNHLVLDLGGGRYAHYMHLQQGSLRVKAGDRVERGQVLALVGNSGNSFAPHLHFEITTSPLVLAGEGIPYAFESFYVLDDSSDTAVRHEAELPLEKMLVDFGGSLHMP